MIFLLWLEVYPRVKVRQEEDPITKKEETTSYLLGAINSLCIEGHSSTRIPVANQGSECKSSPPQSHLEISNSYSRNLLTPSVSTSKGKSSKGADDDNRIIIRASSVPRPRAVLSSPDNDGMIGSQNQLIRKRERLLKRSNKSSQVPGTETVSGKQNQLTRKSGTPSRNQPLSQITNPQVPLAQRNAAVSTPTRARHIDMEILKNTGPKVKHIAERSTPRKKPVIKGGTQSIRAHERA